MNEQEENIQKNYLKEIKSKYILKQIFENLLKQKSLKLFKYNKNIQKKLEITVKDYKECLESFSSIIIEINPIQEIIERHTVFMNINKPEYKKYFHIYFDDNKEEIKRNYLNKGDKVKKIKIIMENKIKSFESLFYLCECIEAINFKKFNCTNITNMSFMFNKCTSLNQLNLDNINTNNVTYMNSIFS